MLNMADFQSLPNELLYEIMTYLAGSQGNQPALKYLCSMSRQLNAIAKPSLYTYFNDGIENGQTLEQGLRRRRLFLRSNLRKSELIRYVKCAVLGPLRYPKTILSDIQPEDRDLLLSATFCLGLDKDPMWQNQMSNGYTGDAELILLLCSLTSLESLTLTFSDLPASCWWTSRIASIHTALRSCPLSRFLQLPTLDTLTLSGCKRNSGSGAEPGHFWNTFRLCNNSTVKHLKLDNAVLSHRQIRDIFRATPNITSFSYDGCYEQREVTSSKQILELLYPFRQQLQVLAIHMSKKDMVQPEVGYDIAVSNATGNHQEERSLRGFTKLEELCLDMFLVTGPANSLVHEDVLVRFLPPKLRSLSLVNENFAHMNALWKLADSGPLLFPDLEGFMHLDGIPKGSA
ncbi:hypothetical protein EG328_000942 [Venturia inaequalis]|uniref:F-box domain-containing protein n=1 Tax=Venturia inaequalis TaxID=5025 RepID=A0A8H3YQY2_VENIN|nr:hypothetical protein EG327_010944 [Venturia inaequalis]KAE9987998.1 hypothetical protein EG328_000942 [Venturia inaequalis]